MEIPLSTVVSIRDAGHDEYWLQDLIARNPACLGLGDLEAISKERRQASGGRLDLLLKNRDDDSMYEVEIMLGETDESHIIRTIEYWDNEQRRWPQREHHAVLVAEHITNRFFNVIQLLSHSIPIIAIQVNVLEVGGQRSIHFFKVLDTYEELDDGGDDARASDEQSWKNEAPWTIDNARALVDIAGNIFESPTIRFLKGYIAVTVNGNNFFWFHERKSPKSRIGFTIGENSLDHVTKLLDDANIAFVRKEDWYQITCDADFLRKNAELFRKIAAFVKEARQK